MKTTTKEKIITAFNNGEVLTSCNCAEKYLTADLRRIITDLRREGMNILDTWVTSANGKRYKKYFLKKEYIQTLLF